eukprot:NODE_355_length_2361_cov_46.264100_g63_i1.p1 GENE.NODE_355_length_2361_cov_46.264100_g63_i1~~NODE_355_length_2361_cov_46.264100_g63_i1.p1  ORF type:complete len:728 (-),score=110.45 NODE_355_length_2361_cov_46.264100_g63_i1:98-2281(-)
MIDEDERICRVCREGDFDGRLFGPCKCKGSIRWVHQTCLLSWIAHSKSLKCEMCFHPFKLTKVYHRRSPPKLSLTLVFQHQRQICSLWLKRIFRFLVWASLSLFLGPLLVGIALRIYITPVIQWPIAYPHFCRGLIRKWVFGFCVILFCNLFQASWHVWRRWYQVAVASWVQPLSESESTEPSRQPSQSSFSDFHPSDLSQDSEVAELNIGSTDAMEAPAPFDTPPRSEAQISTHHLPSDPNFLIDDDQLVPTSVLPAGSSWVNLSDQHPPSPPSPIRPTTPDAPLPQLTPEPQIAPESSASNPASLLSASLTSFFRFFAEICCVTTVLPCLIGLVMCWVLAPFFQTGEHFDVDIVEQQRSIGCLITWATAWFNTGFALPPFLHMMWYWGCGVLYLSLVLTFQYAVLKPIINPGVDLWFMHFRPGPEEEETWDSLLREIVREPFWRSFLAYAKGLLRDVVVIICLIRTPLKLTRKIVADHLFPIPLFPQDSQQQYSPSLHFCQAFVAFILLFAIVQSFNIRLFLTSTCFKFLSGISTPLRMDTYLLCPDGLLESDTDTEEDTPPESPLSDTDLEEPPQSCFMLKKCALVMLIWGASIISLTMLVAIPLAFADLAVNYPFDARVSKINPICCLIALLVLTGSFRAVTVAHWVGRLLYFLGTIFCFGCLCSTFLVRLPLRACYHLARHSLHMLCNPIQGWRGSRRRWCQSVYDQLYLEGLRLHNLESVP